MHLLSHIEAPQTGRLTAALGMCLLLSGARVEAETGPFYEDLVAPILKAHCADCHNPEKRKGELDLSSPAGIIRGGESGPIFVTGDAGHSHLLELVEKAEMPKKGEPLSPGQIESIRGWIAGGAHFRNPPKPVENDLNQHDVLPIVMLRCTACHGPRKQDGGLDLRTPVAMRKGGKNGPSVIPGDPDASPMIQRIESQACPPQELLLKYFVKRPSSAEIKTLREWIAAGTPEKDVAPDVATTEPDSLVSDEDRQHWAFVAPRRASNPEHRRSSIDDFIFAKLQEKDLTFSPEANRDSLIRRAYLDLVGMPPSVDAWQKWRSSENSEWYETMIDQLLASPRYGERWGRYWLDLAGYADSEGGTSADPIRAVAWKYRDYVIGAFNDDKPYDRFLLEQIAGDELIDCEKASEITDEMVENLVATGFLRMGIDQTGSRTMNFVPERLGVIGDAINVLGSGVMGLTLECVRCHSHKYDPIPHRDYYRLKAIFQGAYDEFDWMSFKTRSLKIATEEHRKRVAEKNPPLESEIKKLETLRKKKHIQWQREMLRRHYPGQPEADRKETFKALRIADNQRTQPQRILVEMLQQVLVIPNHEQPESVQEAHNVVNDLDRKMAGVRVKMEPSLAIRALWDRGQPSPTYILRRGEHEKPGRLVGPGVLSALTDGQTPFGAEPPFPDGTPKTGRRLAFARWLTRPDHPLTARVMVNRIWLHHFGSGLVRTVENFGVKGDRPSHPKLLDWLAIEFVDQGWSIKEMHRLIMNSRAYRQSSRITDERLERDPQNRLLSRMPLRRMNAEALRDSLLFVSGKLDETPGGPPDGVTVNREGLVDVNPAANGGWRRSVYAQYRRTEIPTMMDTFDYPEMGPNCVSRSISTVSPQSLMLMNNDRVRKLASAFAARVEDKSPGDDLGRKVDAVYHIALSRPPTAEERKLGIDTLKKTRDQWPEKPTGSLDSFCHTILNSAGFIYLD